MKRQRVSEGNGRRRPILVGSVLSILLGLVGLASLSGSAAGETAGSEPGSGGPPVVLLIFDELPTTALLDGSADISKSRFPNFHRLGTESTWYRNNTTVADFTVRAVPAIMTGRTPQGIYPDFRDYGESIFSFLGGAGYSLRTAEIFTQLCPPSICPAEQRPQIDPLPGETPLDFGQRILRSVPDRTTQRNRWINGLRQLKDGEAAVGHFLFPHAPYTFLPNGMRYEDLQRRRPVVGGPDDTILDRPGLIGIYQQRLLMQLGFADRLLGRVMRAIEASGAWDRATVVVTADHGISLDPGTSRRTVQKESRYGIGMTPLFVKLPGQGRGGTSEAMTSTTDILPTIASAIGRLESLHPTTGVPVSTIPAGREPGIQRSDGLTFRFTRKGARTWLSRQAERQAERFGDRSLAALGSQAERIGGRSPARSRDWRRLVELPDLRRLRSERRRAYLPALIEGFVRRGRKLPVGTELLLSLGGRWVAGSPVFEADGRRAFSFMVHPRLLPDRKLRKLEIFRVTRSGRAVRVF